MPYKAKIPCRACGQLCDRGLCDEHRRERDRARPSAAQRGYDAEWREFRSTYLVEHNVCESDEGCARIADELHHVVRLEDGGAKYLSSNLQALCSVHHRRLGGSGGRA